MMTGDNPGYNMLLDPQYGVFDAGGADIDDNEYDEYDGYDDEDEEADE